MTSRVDCPGGESAPIGECPGGVGAVMVDRLPDTVPAARATTPAAVREPGESALLPEKSAVPWDAVSRDRS